MDEIEKRSPLLREGWTLAQKWKHPLHPTLPGVLPSNDEKEEGEIEQHVIGCPVCVIRSHLTPLKLLMDKWMDFGGPWRNLDQEKDPEGLR
jgi:hypothetical protein